jgi:hypothetical protein
MCRKIWQAESTYDIVNKPVRGATAEVAHRLEVLNVGHCHSQYGGKSTASPVAMLRTSDCRAFSASTY